MENSIFKKKVFGGYDCIEVEENTRMLQDDLHIAKRSYEEKLEEYASNLSMVSLQRDKMAHEIDDLKQKLGSCRSENEDIQKRAIKTLVEVETNMQVKEIIKQNEELTAIVNEAKEEWDKLSSKSEDMRLELVELKKLVAELKAENRNLAMSVDMKVSDYKERTHLDIDKISESLSLIDKALEEMRANEEKLP